MRLVDSAAPRPQEPGARPERGATERRGGERRVAERGDLEQAHRLALALGPERTEELLRFLEEGGPGAFTVVGDEGLAPGRRRARRAGAERVGS